MEDRSKFTYALVFQVEDRAGCLRDYVDRLEFEDLPGARRAHAAAVAGGWVQERYRNPHVSALRVWKHGRLLPEELAAKADVTMRSQVA